MKIRKIAIKRINILFKRALEIYESDLDLAKKYIKIAWMIKNKVRIRMPKKFRNKFCRHCFSPWILGKTLSIRIRKGRKIYRCLICGYVKRFPYK